MIGRIHVISTLHQGIWMIWIPSKRVNVDYYIDTHYFIPCWIPCIQRNLLAAIYIVSILPILCSSVLGFCFTFCCIPFHSTRNCLLNVWTLCQTSIFLLSRIFLLCCHSHFIGWFLLIPSILRPLSLVNWANLNLHSDII